MLTSWQLFLLIWGIFFATGTGLSALAWLVYLGWTRFFPTKPEPVYQYDAWKNCDPWTER